MRRRRMIYKTSGGQIVIINIDYNQVFGLKQIAQGYTGGLIRLSNGISTVTYGYIDVTIVNAFLAAGNGTNEVLEWFDQKGGQSLLFNSGQAPSLFLESDGSFSLKFLGSHKTSNFIEFTGSSMNLVANTQDSGTYNCVLFNANSGVYYFAFGWGTANTTQAVGTPTLRIGLTPISNSRIDLSTALQGGFVAANYSNLHFGGYSFGINRYGGSFLFYGRIKEIFTRTMTNTTEDNYAIQSSLTRNNL
ncbi:MAG: hypothetical protein ACPGSD_07670 [Flavobacteriales bacterium]